MASLEEQLRLQEEALKKQKDKVKLLKKQMLEKERRLEKARYEKAGAMLFKKFSALRGKSDDDIAKFIDGLTHVLPSRNRAIPKPKNENKVSE